MTVLTDKKSLVSFYNKKVLSISKSDFQNKEKAIIQNLCQLSLWDTNWNLAGYQCLPDEANLESFYQFYTNKTKSLVAFPAITEQGLQFYQSRSNKNFILNQFSIREPNPQISKKIESKNMDVFIVPGRVFDRKGHRLGRGKAYYDKALAKHPALKIGVCLSDQVYEQDLPVQSHDISMDMLVTNKFILIPKGKDLKFKHFYQRTA